MPKKNTTQSTSKIESFDFKPGRTLVHKYEVVQRLGHGFESEVYLLKEKNTGIYKAAKFFFPHRNIKNKAVIRYAQKLHNLKDCEIIIQYLSQGSIRFRNHDISFLVSEYVEGPLLKDFLKQQPGSRLHPFQALHFIHALSEGMTEIHRLKEYHGDLHPENIIVQKFGLKFKLKVLDFYNWDKGHNISA